MLGLRELVLGGELPAGSRISELWVADRLGVSRTPIRAALIRLQEEGLVEPIPSGGFAVRSFAESEISDAIELRGTMEGLAARLAAERGASSSLINAMRDVIAQIDSALTGELTAVKFTQYVDLNARFHQLLAEAAGSALIARQIEKVTNLPFASASAFVMVQSIDESAREMLLLAQAQHRSVVEAIELREGTRAEALMREHSRIANHNLKIALQNQQAMSQVLGGSLIRRAGRSI
ncbi:GntR family transcriptional regulator [Cupriavidus sp. UYMU48A]|nr:GntR family transcriptional regulator [Cupriavidus sp. UYMU48A]